MTPEEKDENTERTSSTQNRIDKAQREHRAHERRLKKLLKLAESKENVTPALAAAKQLFELNQDTLKTLDKASWLDELEGMSDAELEERIDEAIARRTSRNGASG